MVRLVFRPYTQVWRSICTSESLRASTRVSSGFALLKHSSPSFGSQQTCSYSNLGRITIGRSMMRPSSENERISPQLKEPLLSLCLRVSITLRLARMLDSLVRVSRRVAWNHMTANILSTSCAFLQPTAWWGSNALQAVRYSYTTPRKQKPARRHVLRLLYRVRARTSQAITQTEACHLLASRITQTQYMLTHTDGKCDSQHQVTEANGPFGSVRQQYSKQTVWISTVHC